MKLEYLYPIDATVRKTLDGWLEERSGAIHMEDLDVLMQRRFNCCAYLLLDKPQTVLKQLHPHYMVRDSVLTRT